MDSSRVGESNLAYLTELIGYGTGIRDELTIPEGVIVIINHNLFLLLIYPRNPAAVAVKYPFVVIIDRLHNPVPFPENI